MNFRNSSRLTWETPAAIERVPDNLDSPWREFHVGTPSLWARAADGLRRLSKKPASLLLALLAVNALFLPYRGRYHDAILYGFQQTFSGPLRLDTGRSQLATSLVRETDFCMSK